MWNRTRSAKKPRKSARASNTSDGTPGVSASLRAKAKESRGARASKEEPWRPKEQSGEDALCAMKQASAHVSAVRTQQISKAKDKGIILQFEEDRHERHVHFEDEAEMGTFSVCILENFTRDNHDEDMVITRDATTIPSTSLTPEDTIDQRRTIQTRLRRNEKVSQPEPRDAYVQTMDGSPERLPSPRHSTLAAVTEEHNLDDGWSEVRSRRRKKTTTKGTSQGDAGMDCSARRRRREDHDHH